MQSFNVEVWMGEYEYGEPATHQPQQLIVPADDAPRPRIIERTEPSVAFLTRKFRHEIDAAVDVAMKRGISEERAVNLIRFVIVPFGQK